MVAKIKIAEMFYSLQGEGFFVSVPSVFLRTFGCNFSCSGFGMPKGELSKERFNINPNEFSKYDELPLVQTGCDSYASWDPRFKHLSPMLTVDAIAKHLLSLIPGHTWTGHGHAGEPGYGDTHLIITGGESLLGWQRSYPELLQQPEFDSLKFITFETNGTQDLQMELIDFFNNKKPNLHVTFSVSPKLPSSGELWESAILPSTVKGYQQIIKNQITLKFVVTSPEDLEDVHKAVDEYQKNNINFLVYIMPVGGTGTLYDANATWVANEALKYGYRYSPRLQVSLWKNAWGT